MIQLSIEKKRIVIVEDDSILQDVLKTMCEMLGHRIVGIYERASEDIFEILEEVDIILMDINLAGDEDGVAYAKRINKVMPVPIIYITGNIEEQTFLDATDTIIHGFLAKPINKQQLEFTIKMSSVRLEYENLIKEQLQSVFQKEKLIEVGNLAGRLVHDLNNFNTAVLNSFLGLQKYSEKKLSDDQKSEVISYVERGITGSKRIQELSDRYRKLINSQFNTEIKLFDMNKFLEEIDFYFRYKFNKNDIVIEFECEDGLCFVSNEILLLQTLVNLVSNSVEALSELDIPKKWIKISVFYDDENFFIKVIDSGLGIPKEIQGLIFDMGFSSKKQSNHLGAGIGLALVRENIKNVLNGSLDYLENEENTTFLLTLPIQIESNFA